jgi:hypothetical protein
MRTAGATSFVTVKLSELNRLLKEDADVPVARRFSEMLKFASKPMTADTPTLIALASRSDFKVVNFDENGEEETAPVEAVKAKTPMRGEEKVEVSILDSCD